MHPSRSPGSSTAAAAIGLAAVLSLIAGCGSTSPPAATTRLSPSGSPSPRPLSEIPEETVARAGDEKITNQHVFERWSAASTADEPPTARKIVDQLVDEALFLTDARRRGLAGDPRVMAAAAAARRPAAAAQLLATLSKDATPDETLLRTLFHSMYDTAELDAIVLASESDAKAVLDRLRAGSSFEEEASHTLSPSGADSGGRIGTVTRGSMDPALAAAVFEAPLDVATGPHRTKLGWVVARVRDRTIGGDDLFAQKRDGLRQMATAQMRAQLEKHTIEQIMSARNIDIDGEFIRSTGKRVDATAEELNHVIATVADTEIRYQQVLASVRQLVGNQNSHMSGPTFKLSIAREIVERTVLEEEAIARGFGDAPEAVAAAQQAERRALIELYVGQVRARTPPITAAQIEAFYRENPKYFERPAKREVLHILLGSQEQAARVYDRLQAGESFASLARDFSLDEESAARDGLVGVLTDAQLETLRASGDEDLAAAIAKAEAERVTGPVRSNNGWHLILTRAHEPASVAALEEVRPAIKRWLHAERGDQALRERALALRDELPVTIDPEALDRAQTQISARRAGQRAH